jgi:cell division protein FtsB
MNEQERKEATLQELEDRRQSLYNEIEALQYDLDKIDEELFFRKCETEK